MNTKTTMKQRENDLGKIYKDSKHHYGITCMDKGIKAIIYRLYSIK
jgi:hypothetical protein